MLTDKELLQEIADHLEAQLETAPECDQKWYFDAIAALARVVDGPCRGALLPP